MEQVLDIIINEVINPLIFLFFGIAILVFLWGVIQYVVGSDSDDKRKVGTRHIAYGILGFVIMMGAIGIIAFVDNSIESVAPDDNLQVQVSR